MIDGVLIVTRYMRQLKGQKRQSRIASDSFLLKRGGYASLDNEDVDYAYHPREASQTSTASATYFPPAPQMTPDGKQEHYIDQ